MPFVVGGGIKDIGTVRKLLAAGAEKVIINTRALLDPDFIKEAVEEFGSSTITVCLDVKRNLWGKKQICIGRGKEVVKGDINEIAQKFESLGAGELIIQSVDRDGMMNGYDIDLVKEISMAVEIPVIALGRGRRNLRSAQCVSTRICQWFSCW